MWQPGEGGHTFPRKDGSIVVTLGPNGLIGYTAVHELVHALQQGSSAFQHSSRIAPYHTMLSDEAWAYVIGYASTRERLAGTTSLRKWLAARRNVEGIAAKLVGSYAHGDFDEFYRSLADHPRTQEARDALAVALVKHVSEGIGGRPDVILRYLQDRASYTPGTKDRKQ